MLSKRLTGYSKVQTMTKNDFKALFLKCVNEAKHQAEKAHQQKLSENHLFRVNGGGVSDQLIPLEETLDILYLSDKQFYRVINVGCKYVAEEKTEVFVGISGHTPSTYDHTINAQSGLGPFKVIIPLEWSFPAKTK